ncbi:tail fiber protein [Erwinia phage vB_EhrS_49]|uniref:Tail fiber protein n=1 Tax=Erwinia phage vB_EhrS_49 TaxID=2283026 RepID=A0A4Y1NR78_9CAUD|nr:tail fiber protein [Erwinia phage vB_EhrS_49]AXH43494.1 tail fiber protein [Erwinia phage vB_EhrS_49]
MPAGTIALTNNSTTVTGTGTSFTSELKVNDFVVAVVGGVAYTLGVAAIASNTSLTLIQKYDGPTTSGLTWSPVPFGTMTAITAQLAAQVTYAIRGLNLDKNNWQQVFTGTGNITVNLPDGSSFTGPAWNSFTISLANKADLVSGAVGVAQGGTGQKTLSGVMTWLGLGDAAFKNTGTASGTLAAGNDSRITGAYPSSGGLISGPVQSTYSSVSLQCLAAGWSSAASSNQIFTAQGTDTRWGVNSDFYLNSGNYWAYRIYSGDPNNGTKVWEFRTDGQLRSPGSVYANGTALTSDRRLKSDFRDVEITLDDIDSFQPQHYTKQNPDDKDETSIELGVIAQDLEGKVPDLVTSFYWNEEYPDLRMVNYSGLTAWLVGYCKLLKDGVKKQGETINAQKVIIIELQKRMKAIDGLDA